MTIVPDAPAAIFYPESDGKPMADNTKQFEAIVMIQGGIDALFRHDPDVFVAGDLFWYPVEGHPEIVVAPDALVVFGRPKGHRGSYRQWQEGGIAPQVVFETLSPSNRVSEMLRKHRFYERHGVEEYYIYNPDTGALDGWLRGPLGLEELAEMRGWVSPRLGVSFDLDGIDLVLRSPDGARFLTYLELSASADAERQRADDLGRELARLRALLGERPEV